MENREKEKEFAIHYAHVLFAQYQISKDMESVCQEFKQYGVKIDSMIEAIQPKLIEKFEEMVDPSEFFEWLQQNENVENMIENLGEI